MINHNLLDTFFFRKMSKSRLLILLYQFRWASWIRKRQIVFGIVSLAWYLIYIYLIYIYIQTWGVPYIQADDIWLRHSLKDKDIFRSYYKQTCLEKHNHDGGELS